MPNERRGLWETELPGPGDYSPRLPQTPGGKIISGVRESDFDRAMRLHGDEPGPGHYEADLALARLAETDRAVTMSRAAPLTALEKQIKKASREPGPGAYSVRSLDATPLALRYSPPRPEPFIPYEAAGVENSKRASGAAAAGIIPWKRRRGGRPRRRRGSSFDGAAAPTRIRPLTRRRGVGAGDDADRHRVARRYEPGPGDYSPGRLNLAPAAFFGRVTVNDSFVSMAEARGRATPAPGAYESRSLGDDVGGGRFMKGLRDDIMAKRNGVPGPGAYAIRDVNKRENNPMAWLGSTLARRVVPTNVPGPGTYEASQMDLSKGMDLGSTSLRAPLAMPNENPGPGAYDVAGELGLGGASVLGFMRSAVSKSDPSFEHTLRRAAATPGPADYAIKSTLSSSGGRFGLPFDPEWQDDETFNSYDDFSGDEH